MLVSPSHGRKFISGNSKNSVFVICSNNMVRCPGAGGLEKAESDEVRREEILVLFVMLHKVICEMFSAQSMAQDSSHANDRCYDRAIFKMLRVIFADGLFCAAKQLKQIKLV